MTSQSSRDEVPVGLCRRCEHARTVTTAKGSVFWRCAAPPVELGVMPKYPRLPVLRCRAFGPTG